MVWGVTLTVHARPKAWECGSVMPPFYRTPAYFADRLCCALSPGLLLWAPDTLRLPSACSRIGDEELHDGGPMAKLYLLHCRRHMHMVRRYCRAVVCAFTFRGDACMRPGDHADDAQRRPPV